MARATKRSESTPRGLVNIRMSPDDRNVIDRAAKVAGAHRVHGRGGASRCDETLLDTNLILADGPTFARFKTLSDAPAQPNEGLRELMALRPPWEEQKD